jgi:hypothetical protein
MNVYMVWEVGTHYKYKQGCGVNFEMCSFQSSKLKHCLLERLEGISNTILGGRNTCKFSVL